MKKQLLDQRFVAATNPVNTRTPVPTIEPTPNIIKSNAPNVFVKVLL